MMLRPGQMVFLGALLAASGCVQAGITQTAPNTERAVSGKLPGQMLPTSGAGVIAAGSGNVIGAGSGNLIAAAAGNVIGAGSGNLTVHVSGQLLAPAGVIAAGSGNVIGAGSGNVIAAGSGNVIGAGSGNFGPRYGLLDVPGAPLANVPVYLADELGKALAGSAPVLTDAQGHFTISGSPGKANFAIAAAIKTAAGKNGLLQTLVHGDSTASSADINAATTLAAALTLRTGQGSLSGFDRTNFSGIVQRVTAHLAATDLAHLDWSDSGSLADFAQQLAPPDPAPSAEPSAQPSSNTLLGRIHNITGGLVQPSSDPTAP